MEQTEQTGTLAQEKASTATTAEHGTNLVKREFLQVPQDQLLFVSDFVLETVRKIQAATDGEMEVEDYLARLQSNHMQFFMLTEDGVPCLGVITEFVIYPRFKMLRIVGTAGKDPIKAMKYWEDFCHWAKLNNARGVETFSTPETKILNKRLGMTEYVTLMRHFI